MELNKLIDAWLNHKDGLTTESSMDLYDFTPDQIDKVLKSVGYSQDDIESNGWQHDFWIYYVSTSETLPPLTVSGCWWDGTMQIRKRI